MEFGREPASSCSFAVRPNFSSNQLRTSSEPASVMEVGFFDKNVRQCIVKHTRPRRRTPRPEGAEIKTKTGAYNITGSTSFDKNAASLPHIWTIQSYSPRGANVHPHVIHASMDPDESTSKRYLDRFSRFCRAVTD